MTHRRPSGSSYAATRPGYAGSPPALPGGHNQTLRLPNAPPLPSRSKAPPALLPETKRTSAKPDQPIEIEWVDKGGVDPLDGTWTLFEIWTRNRIYHVDSSLVCSAVVTRTTGKPELAHPLKGARLTGGERRTKEAQLTDIFYPLPSPGTEAVFRTDVKNGKGQFAKTSTVEKIVLRIRRVNVTSRADADAWDGVLGKSRPK
jgi:hypothetical protein